MAAQAAAQAAGLAAVGATAAAGQLQRQQPAQNRAAVLTAPLPSLSPPACAAPPAQDVKSVRWHPLGEVLVSASYDDSIKLWVEEDDEWVCAQTLAGEGGAQ